MKLTKNQAHDIVHQWYGGLSENCPSCNGDSDDAATMGEAKQIALANYKPRTNPLLPYDQRMTQYAELDSKDRNSLADSEFAYVDANGGKHLPIPDASHVRNALARFSQTHFDNDGDKEKAKEKIDAAAKKFGVKVSADEKETPDEEREFSFRPLVDLLSFGEKANDNLPSRIKLIPVGEYNMATYGKVKITKEKIAEMVKHFNENIRAHTKEIGLPIDIEHGTTQWKDAAAGWIKKMYAEDDGGYGDVDWTSLGKKLLTEKLYKLYSPEFYFEYKDPQHGYQLKNVMTGGGLVNKPMIKDDLPAIVNSETGQNKNLTKEKTTITLYAELVNDSKKPDENMKLSEIIAKEKSSRTSEEQKFLTDHKDELTLSEARKEGLLPEETKKISLNEGEVAVSQERLDSLISLAEKGAEAHAQLKKAALKEEVKQLVFSEKGSKLPADQIDVAVELLMTMSEDNAKKYKEQLKALPEKQIFVETGNTDTTTGSAAGADLETKIQKYMEDKKVSYREAAKAVVAENKVQFKEYTDNMPIARQER